MQGIPTPNIYVLLAALVMPNTIQTGAVADPNGTVTPADINDAAIYYQQGAVNLFWVWQTGAHVWLPCPSFKVYRATLTQTGADAPVATVMQDDFGGVAFAYNSPGIYEVINTTTGWTADKTFIMSDATAYMYGDSGSIACKRLDATYINIRTTDNATPTDGILNNSSLQIIVFS